MRLTRPRARAGGRPFAGLSPDCSLMAGSSHAAKMQDAARAGRSRVELLAVEWAMKEPARLIIPLWGEAYANKLVSITLPALLAPGNLPTFCTQFDVELVIVTENRLITFIEATPSFRRAATLCRCRFVSLDDLMTDTPGDYGVTLTYALFRGFTDLGPRMTQTYLLFFNADFIVCDGALRHVAELMRQGKQVIHAPSFRVVLEDV